MGEECSWLTQASAQLGCLEVVDQVVGNVDSGFETERDVFIEMTVPLGIPARRRTTYDHALWHVNGLQPIRLHVPVGVPEYEA